MIYRDPEPPVEELDYNVERCLTRTRMNQQLITTLWYVVSI
jgi:hypothetical protein